MTKKFLSALLAVLMVISMVPMAAVAATEEQDPLAGLEVTEVGFFADADNFKSYINGTYYLNNGAGVNDVSPNTVFVRMNKAVPDGYGLYMLVQAFDSDNNRIGSNAKTIKSPNSFAYFANDDYASANRIAALIGIYELDSSASDQNTQFGDSSFDSIRWSTESEGWKEFPNNTEGKPTYGNSKNWNIPINTTKDAKPCTITLNETGLAEGAETKGEIVWTNAKTEGDKITAKIGAPVEFAVTAPEGYTVKSVKLDSEAIAAEGGKYKFVVTKAMASVAVEYAAESTATPEPSTEPSPSPIPEKDALVEKILEKMAADTTGAPLHDTRNESEETAVKDTAIADNDLYTAGSYTVTAEKSATADIDIDVDVAIEGLKGHQNAASPKSMGYWVGVKFPVVDGWTISAYKRDGQQSSASIDASDFTTEGDVTTLNGYYNVGDTSEEVTNSRVRPVWVTYKKGEQTVDVKFNVDLTGVEIVVPAKEPEEDGTLSEETTKELVAAINAAATGSSTNHEDTGEASKDVPTVSVGTIADGTVTIDKTIVGALKEAADDGDKNDVDLKIVGQGGAEATIPATTAKALDAAKDLKPTVKAETTEVANIDTENLTADAATKAIVTRALESLDAEGKYVVTVTMEQESKLFTDPASCEIIVKVPVPSADYDTVIHISENGEVTKEPAEKGGDAENGYFLTVTLNHLSQVFGAKSSEVSDIPVDPGELGAAAMPKVTYTELADMTGAVTGVNGTINQNDVYNESGVLVVKNTSEATQRYIISVGPKATANSFNIAYVVKLEKDEQYVLQCQQTLAVKVVGVGMTTNLNEKFKMEDFDIDDWVNVTEAENSYTGVTAD
ncbi:hypothetical protein [Acutalibacter muris]|uniref:hypothetical protein n=1 Tax=Acutalibacter muris TaxID=1796620 RepID=UPI002729BAEB|nr:hypothetical protein [Acutalibacter muris]